MSPRIKVELEEQQEDGNRHYRHQKYVQQHNDCPGDILILTISRSEAKLCLEGYKFQDENDGPDDAGYDD